MHHAQSGARAGKGIRWPRLYDLMVLVLTRGRDRTFREAILDLAGAGPGTDLLDVGCGTGTLALSACARVGSGKVRGTDISEPMLEAARRKARRARSAVSFLHADAAGLPFEAGSFDIVTMTTAMHMIPAGARQSSIEEMARVLRPGGRALIVDYGGPISERRSMAATHGLHGAFDLYRYQDGMGRAGFSQIEAGATGWLDLHFLRGVKG